MRRILLIYSLIISSGLQVVHAQVYDSRQGLPEDQFDPNNIRMDPSMQPENLDSMNVQVEGLAPKIHKMWNVNEIFGDIIPIPVDTVHHHFQNTNLMEGMKGYYNYLGNLGTVRYSRLFFERPEASANIFIDPYSSFIRPIDRFKFTNSNVPYTNLSYYKAGGKVDGEELFKGY
ncbi:hypothetical protein EZS27_038674, partial [termite gut metagenome]